MVGGLDSGKVLRVVGMAATMRLSDRGPDDPSTVASACWY
ncbi:chemotaxis protein MotB (motility protein B) [Escherichia coli]|nr:chemotaxis protein MotB (motility protein B) [Escherichia coli]